MDNCLFCKIIKGEIKSNKVAENNFAFAFHDINKQAPTHILIIPKRHSENISSMTDSNEIGNLFIFAASIAKNEGLENGFRLVLNTGKDGGQTVFHTHIHLLGKRALAWPPG
jgi:histidine triad (HIT) family protein